MSIDALVELSRLYGGNGDYVLAGGGNTSWKDEDTLYVKASGFSLADAAAASFVKMDRKALSLIWEKTYPSCSEERESAVLADMMAARKPDETEKRPSVEALLHDIIPFPFVVHLHPALVNGLCCSKLGEETAKEIFGNEAIWIPSTNPGYILSGCVKNAMDQYRCKNGKDAPVILLQNHGVFVGADTKDGIIIVYDNIISKIGALIKRHPDFSDEKIIFYNKDINAGNSIDDIFKTLKELSDFTGFMQSAEIMAVIKDRASFYPVSSAFTPDHIVYAGSDPLFTESAAAEEIRADWENHAKKTGLKPKIVAVKGMGVFSAASTEKGAKAALDLFKDTVKVAVFTESFGGPLFMTQDKIDFINNWEVERFRSSVSTK